MQCYLIRHGVTKGNQEGRYVGRTDEPVLCGELERLKYLGGTLSLVQHVFSSPLLRCRQSGEALFFSNNIFMSSALVYIGAAGFLLAVFPVHIYNYLYLNTVDKYVSVNAGVFKFNFFNANTIENDPTGMQINGKNKKINL